MTRFIAAAPAESTCSHSGIFTCGAARLTTATTSGARASRLRSNATWSSVACGLFALNTAAIDSPAFLRASSANTMKRQGVSLPWSGTRDATVSSVSSSAGAGPGPISSIGFTDRRVFSKSKASGMRGLPCT